MRYIGGLGMRLMCVTLQAEHTSVLAMSAMYCHPFGHCMTSWPSLSRTFACTISKHKQAHRQYSWVQVSSFSDINLFFILMVLERNGRFYLPYSGKLSREKTFANLKIFTNWFLLPDQRTSRPKISQSHKNSEMCKSFLPRKFSAIGYISFF